jgi:hypothetical protein
LEINRSFQYKKHRQRARLLPRALALPAAVTSAPGIASGPLTPGTPWVVSTWYTGAGGKPASQSVINQVLQHYPVNGPRTAQVLAEHGITQWWGYIPVSRFWPMQFIEGGWLLAFSVVLTAATVWLVRGRAA